MILWKQRPRKPLQTGRKANDVRVIEMLGCGYGAKLVKSVVSVVCLMLTKTHDADVPLDT